MNFLFKWLKRKLSSVEYNHKSAEVPLSLNDTDFNTFQKGIKFSVYNADGGHVIETSYYDQHHNRQTNLYLVTNDQDLGERISHIITIESIKR